MGIDGGLVTSKTPAIHATTVAHAGKAVVIRGASGSGKSALALQLIALGARLVADDRTLLSRRNEQVIASCPSPIAGRIEARGIGILAVPTSGPCPVALVVDMDTEEAERLPPHRHTTIEGITLPLQRNVKMPHFPAAILSYLEHGRLE